MFWLVVLACFIFVMISNSRRGRPSPRIVSSTPRIQVRRQETRPKNVTMAWVPEGKSVHIAGRELEGGLIYFGEGGVAPAAIGRNPHKSIRHFL